MGFTASEKMCEDYWFFTKVIIFFFIQVSESTRDSHDARELKTVSTNNNKSL